MQEPRKGSSDHGLHGWEQRQQNHETTDHGPFFGLMLILLVIVLVIAPCLIKIASRSASTSST
jgi:hypothetical protein